MVVLRKLELLLQPVKARNETALCMLIRILTNWFIKRSQCGVQLSLEVLCAVGVQEKILTDDLTAGWGSGTIVKQPQPIRMLSNFLVVAD